MTRQEFLLALDESLELAPGTLTGSEKLDDLEQWDSVAMLNYIALADSNLGVSISPRDILSCATVGDLLTLAKAGA